MTDKYNFMMDFDTTLEYCCTNVPLKALGYSTRKRIALFLDIQILIFQKDIDLLRDWRGLAELASFTNLQIRNLERSKSPTLDLLDNWESNEDYRPTLGDLWSCLLQLDRKDVITECKKMIERDAKRHIATEERLANDYNPVQEHTISSTTHPSPDHFVDDTIILTIEDVADPENRVIYDAFVCYNSDSKGRDGAFVKECVKQLEINRKIRLCIPERNCLVGGARYTCDAALIKERCRRMIIVVSNEFLHSPACDFQIKFAHSLEPGARKKRLIPVLLEEKLPIPDIIRHVTMCDFTKPDLMEWFWDRLAGSIRAPLDTTEETCNKWVTPKTIRRPSSSSTRSSSDSSNSLVSMTSLESLDTNSPKESTQSNGDRLSKAKNFFSRVRNFVKK